MTSTYPTRVVTLLDVPDPKRIRARFQYNFFVPDEMTDESGSGFKTSTSTRSKVFDLMSGDVPRFVKIQWTPVVVNSPGSGRRLLGGDVLNPRTSKLIQDEQTFSNLDFVGFNFQDVGIDGKLHAKISKFGRIRREDVKDTVAIVRRIDEEIPGNLGRKVLLQLAEKIFPNIKRENRQDDLEDVRNISVKVQVSNKVVGTVVRNASEDTYNSYSRIMSQFTSNSSLIQASVASNHVGGSVSSIEWDSSFTPIDVTPLDPDDDVTDLTGITTVGYLVEKSTLGKGGKVQRREVILVNGSRSTSMVDPEVRYGGRYRYKVKSVAAITLPGTDEEGRLFLMRGLISSQSVSSRVVNCVESEPPPPPGDFKPVWDYTTQNLKLMWSFPVSRQRDVKYFQVFRRKSITEPFTLLGMFDFNDSDDPVKLREEVDPRNVLKIKDPVTYYVDRGFTKDSAYIYALACVDAHGFTSPLSTQFQVSFDRFSNKLILHRISQAGAPKAYPNAHISQEAFVDVLKTSNYKRMTVHFAPDFLQVADRSGSDLNFLPLRDPSGLFKFLVVNVDNQESQVVDVRLDDRRVREKRRRKKPKVSVIKDNILSSFTGLDPDR